MTFPKLAKQNT